MNHKQKMKFENEIVELENIHRNPKSTEEEVRKAETRIVEITNILAALPDGYNIMMEIDGIIQKKLKK